MAGVEVQLIRPADPASVVGSKEWLENSVFLVRGELIDVTKSAIPALQLLSDLLSAKAWEIAFADEPKTWERFVSEVLECEPAFINHLMLGGEVFFGTKKKVIEPPSIKELVHVGQAQEMAADAAVTPLTAHGAIGRGRDRDDNIISKSGQGTSAEYLVRRLKRDAPEIAAALGRGEYRSARAAAIAAGIIRVPTLTDMARRIYRKMSPEERAAFLDWVNQEGA